MKFVCLGYMDEGKWEDIPEAERQRMMEECFDYDDELRRGGHFVGGEALQSAGEAVTLRVENGGVVVTDGPFTETKETLGGILLLEARDRDHAIALMSKHPGVKAGPFEIRPAHAEINAQIAERDQSANAERQSAGDETEIRRLIADWSKALEAKDLDGLTAEYAPDAILFDACPPYQTIGADNIRKVWENCLPYFPETFRSEHRDLTVHVDGDVAFVHCLHHFVPTPADHPCGQTWMRVTACYRRIDGRWKAVHEHVSVPFNPMNGQAFFITNPDVAEMPSYDEPPAPRQTQEQSA